MNAYRVFHGDADGAAGLAIDRYGDVLVVHTDSFGLLDQWRAAVQDEMGMYRAAYAKVHPPQPSRLSQAQRAALAPTTPMWGPAVDEIEIVEQGVKYSARPSGGLAVGLFLDMRDVRLWLRQHSHAAQVLNLFAYTCAFGVCASLGGASRVLNIDVSKTYLEWGRRNYGLNGLDVDDRDFVFGDALDWLGRFARRDQHFELVIVDPPSYSSTPFSVTRDYPRLVHAAARVVAHGGILLAATNHAETSDERFDTWLQTGVDSAGRRARLVQRWHEPALDFPVAGGRRPYLKVRALVVY